eukprot:COSAG02_NODE_10609_length_1901_cov_1.169256_2_plen_162_part_00
MISIEICRSVYDPTSQPRDSAPFVVHFDQDAKAEQSKRADRVIQHLRSLGNASLKEESAVFFRWLVLHHLSSCNQHYARTLLQFFHSEGLLLGKSSVDNPVKQLKHRYLVVFSMGKQTFAKRYNSIRELKVDTGKRPTQIQRCTTDLKCQTLAKNPITKQS